MSLLTIDMPCRPMPREQILSGWFAQSSNSKSLAGLIALCTTTSDVLKIGIDDAQLALPLKARECCADASVEIAPGLRLPPVATSSLASFLSDQWQHIDHIGINLSHADIEFTEWQRFIAALSAVLPTYRLEVGSANDIVIVIRERAAGERPAVLELVYDRAAARSTLHLCIALSGNRAEVEHAFPAPWGAYKPGDEPFFRSVALSPGPYLPVYLDLAFSDGQMAPWLQIVSAVGRRIE